MLVLLSKSPVTPWLRSAGPCGEGRQALSGGVLSRGGKPSSGGLAVMEEGSFLVEAYDPQDAETLALCVRAESWHHRAHAYDAAAGSWLGKHTK